MWVNDVFKSRNGHVMGLSKKIHQYSYIAIAIYIYIQGPQLNSYGSRLWKDVQTSHLDQHAPLGAWKSKIFNLELYTSCMYFLQSFEILKSAKKIFKLACTWVKPGPNHFQSTIMMCSNQEMAMHGMGLSPSIF